jgi:hypothetical protein
MDTEQEFHRLRSLTRQSAMLGSQLRLLFSLGCKENDFSGIHFYWFEIQGARGYLPYPLQWLA